MKTVHSSRRPNEDERGPPTRSLPGREGRRQSRRAGSAAWTGAEQDAWALQPPGAVTPRPG